jgi:Mg2+ and Co2+ transporter CorA
MTEFDPRHPTTKAILEKLHSSPVVDKKDRFYELQRLHQTGNFYPQWSYEDLLKSGYKGMVSVRDLTSGRSDNSRAIYRILISEVPDHLREPDIGVVFIPSHSNKHITFQGEYSENCEFSARGSAAELRYTFVKKPMLVAFEEESLRATGLKARLLLRHYMDSNSLEMLYELIDRHTDFSNTLVPTVEFQCYDIAVGIFGWNTIFWEVRNY